uniref:Uncharacterized protein n=1 Tax=uncultured marine microorganism HF4000_009L19 TaxID=455516 RepID=B3T1F9_9ZZZZ|nr:hypothetical protein ALOHA_HF4000009L19ctg1g15 [uncultured marine microorganism HF4000_009L19]
MPPTQHRLSPRRGKCQGRVNNKTPWRALGEPQFVKRHGNKRLIARQASMSGSDFRSCKGPRNIFLRSADLVARDQRRGNF